METRLLAKKEDVPQCVKHLYDAIKTNDLFTLASRAVLLIYLLCEVAMIFYLCIFLH